MNFKYNLFYALLVVCKILFPLKEKEKSSEGLLKHSLNIIEQVLSNSQNEDQLEKNLRTHITLDNDDIMIELKSILEDILKNPIPDNMFAGEVLTHEPRSDNTGDDSLPGTQETGKN